MSSIIKWIVTSSANPQNASLTIKGILLQYVSLIMTFAGLFNLNVTQDALYHSITTFCALIGALLSVVGMVRKLYFELKRPV